MSDCTDGQAMSTRTAERYLKYFDNSPDSIFYVRRSGTIVETNKRVMDMFGYEPAELVGKSIDILVPEHVRPRHPVLRDSFFADPEPRPMGADSKLFGRRRDGSTFPIDIALSPIEVDGDVEVIAEVRDISKRRSLETDVSRFQAAFEDAFDAMVIADDEGRYVEVNQSACEMFEMDREELLGRQIWEFAPDDFDFEAAWEAFQSSELDRGLFTVVTDKGTNKHVEYAATTDIVPGQHLSVLRDVTEREERNQQLQVLETVLRHNLRNNMNIIQGYAELLAQSPGEESAAMAHPIIETGEDLLAKVDKARQIAKVLSEPPERVAIDLVSLLERIQADVTTRNGDADISLDAPDSAVVSATTNLEGGIVELVENAIEFSDKPEPTVEVVIERVDETYQVHVTDDGPGIPMMEIDVLTGAKEVNPLYHGSGFGLWLVHLVVQQSKGHLSFAENDPQGSIVTITIPVSDTE